MVQNGFMKNWNFILELCPIFIVLRNVSWREPAHIFLHLLHCPRHFYLSSNIVYSCNLRYVPCFFSVSLCTNAVYLHQPIQFIFKKRTLHFQNLTPTPNAIPLGKKRDKKIYILNIYICVFSKSCDDTILNSELFHFGNMADFKTSLNNYFSLLSLSLLHQKYDYVF